MIRVTMEKKEGVKDTMMMEEEEDMRIMTGTTEEITGVVILEVTWILVEEIWTLVVGWISNRNHYYVQPLVLSNSNLDHKIQYIFCQIFL